MSLVLPLSKPAFSTQELIDTIVNLPLPSDKLVIKPKEAADYTDYYHRMIDQIVAEQEKIGLTKRIVDSLSKQQILKILNNLEYVTNFLETIENGN